MMRVVNLFKRLCIFFAILHCASQGNAQIASSVDLKTLVVIKKEVFRFDELVNSISRQAPVLFSFSSKRIASDKLLKMRTGRQTLLDVLKQINATTGLSYKVVGNHVIFLDQQPPHRSNLPESNSKPGTNTKRTAKSLSKPQGLKKASPSSRGLISDTVRSLTKNTASDSIEGNNSQKKTASVEDSLLRDERTTTQYEDQEKSDRVDKNLKQTDSISERLMVTDTAIDKFPGLQKDNATSTMVSPGTDTDRSDSKTTWFAGAELLMTTNAENRSQKLKATGVGIGIKMERSFSRSFSWTVAGHFNYFTGKFSYTSFTGVRDTSVTNFAMIPIFAGLKYYPIPPIYLSFEFGPSINARKTTTKLAVTPSAGVLLPLKNGNTVDLGIKYSHIVRGFATPETPGLQAGGYGILAIRVAYGIKRF